MSKPFNQIFIMCFTASNINRLSQNLIPLQFLLLKVKTAPCYDIVPSSSHVLRSVLIINS